MEKKETHAAYLQELEEAEGKLGELLSGLVRRRRDGADHRLQGRAALARSPAACARTFGRHKHPRFDTYTVHNGIEIAAAADTPVAAVHDGTVAFSDQFLGYGLMVILDHGGKNYTLYAHLAEARVKPGERVAAGATLGTVGAYGAGRAGGVLRGALQGKPQDPMEWLADGSRALDNNGGRSTPTPSAYEEDPERSIGRRSRIAITRMRLLVSFVSTLLVGYVAVGSLLGRVLGDTTYGQLAVFNEVVRLVLDAYVEPVNIDRAMTGARIGLTDALDGDSSYLDAEELKAYQQPPDRRPMRRSGSSSPAGSRS